MDPVMSTAPIHFRVGGPDLDSMAVDAMTAAAGFYCIEIGDPRLVVTFLGAVPARLFVDGDGGPEYPDGVNLLCDLGWIGRWEAAIVDPEPEDTTPPAHALHPAIRRVFKDGEPGPYAELGNGTQVKIVTACGRTAGDGLRPPILRGPLYQWPAGAEEFSARVRRPALHKAGITCEDCLAVDNFPALTPR
jgi:hypothetical protein